MFSSPLSRPILTLGGPISLLLTLAVLPIAIPLALPLIFLLLLVLLVALLMVLMLVLLALLVLLVQHTPRLLHQPQSDTSGKGSIATDPALQQVQHSTQHQQQGLIKDRTMSGSTIGGVSGAARARLRRESGVGHCRSGSCHETEGRGDAEGLDGYSVRDTNTTGHSNTLPASVFGIDSPRKR